jgi:hypothetical protein
MKTESSILLNYLVQVSVPNSLTPDTMLHWYREHYSFKYTDHSQNYLSSLYHSLKFGTMFDCLLNIISCTDPESRHLT